MVANPSVRIALTRLWLLSLILQHRAVKRKHSLQARGVLAAQASGLQQHRRRSRFFGAGIGSLSADQPDGDDDDPDDHDDNDDWDEDEGEEEEEEQDEEVDTNSLLPALPPNLPFRQS